MGQKMTQDDCWIHRTISRTHIPLFLTYLSRLGRVSSHKRSFESFASSRVAHVLHRIVPYLQHQNLQWVGELFIPLQVQAWVRIYKTICKYGRDCMEYNSTVWWYSIVLAVAPRILSGLFWTWMVMILYSKGHSPQVVARLLYRNTVQSPTNFTQYSGNPYVLYVL